MNTFHWKQSESTNNPQQFSSDFLFKQGSIKTQKWKTETQQKHAKTTKDIKSAVQWRIKQRVCDKSNERWNAKNKERKINDVSELKALIAHGINENLSLLRFILGNLYFWSDGKLVWIWHDRFKVEIDNSPLPSVVKGYYCCWQQSGYC